MINVLRSATQRWLSVLGVTFAAQAQAVEMPDTFQVHGFMSQALILTDHNDFFGPSSRDTGSLEYTELGLNASFRPRSNVLVAGQVLSRKAGGYGDAWKPTLDYGVIDYQLLSGERRVLGLQVGRFKNPFGIYNQTRDVPSTRAGILLPQSIYFDRSRSLGLASDGITVYDEERFSRGTLYIQGGLGIPQVNGDAEISLSPTKPSLDGRISSILQVLYAHDGGRVNLGVSAARVRSSFQSRQNPSAKGEFVFQPVILSAQYNAERWSLTAEYEYQHKELKDFDNDIYNSTADGESWYVQYQFRLTPDWQWLLRYDQTVSDRNDREGSRYASEGRGPSYSRFARDLSTGIKWSLSSRWMVQAEWHHVDGTAWLPRQDNESDEETTRRWNMLLFQTSYSF
ncbi:hypothetical protein [Salinicola endophyticus]|uniref:hypothetical protein n=1 Tax=Salinicola endophyticus TaxID=1949083 RepID=UPI001FDA63B7|nr:hypothetical protein [Salinicola endophyticus]